MRALLQRVRSGSVEIEGQLIGKIGQGLVVLLAVTHGDSDQDAEWLARKIVNLRIFSDDEGKMNLSLLDQGGEMLIVSQFTLYAACGKGLRPSFTQAAPLEQANRLYEALIKLVKNYGVTVRTGVFQADMLVTIENDGPVTIMIDSKEGNIHERTE